MTYIHNYSQEGLFRCDLCFSPLWEGDRFIRLYGKRICKNCIDNMIEYATWEDSDEANHFNQLVHERIDDTLRR